MDNKYIMAEKQDFEIIRIDKFSFSKYLGNNEGIESIDITNYIEKNKINSMNYMFELINYYDKEQNIKRVRLTSNSIISMEYTFSETILESLDLSELNTENVISFFQAFQGFESQNLNLDNFNTKIALTFDEMFSCSKIKKLDISSFYINDKANFYRMFESFTCEELILPNSFPINFNKRIFDIFYNSEIEIIKTQNEEFYKKNKEWFKNKHNTELILI